MQISDDDEYGSTSLMSVRAEIKISIDSNLATAYAMASPQDWNMVKRTYIRRRINLIPYTRESNKFEVKNSTEELKGLFNA